MAAPVPAQASAEPALRYLRYRMSDTAARTFRRRPRDRRGIGDQYAAWCTRRIWPLKKAAIKSKATDEPARVVRQRRVLGALPLHSPSTCWSPYYRIFARAQECRAAGKPLHRTQDAGDDHDRRMAEAGRERTARHTLDRPVNDALGGDRYSPFYRSAAWRHSTDGSTVAQRHANDRWRDPVKEIAARSLVIFLPSFRILHCANSLQRTGWRTPDCLRRINWRGPVEARWSTHAR